MGCVSGKKQEQHKSAGPTAPGPQETKEPKLEAGRPSDQQVDIQDILTIIQILETDVRLQQQKLQAKRKMEEKKRNSSSNSKREAKIQKEQKPIRHMPKEGKRKNKRTIREEEGKSWECQICFVDIDPSSIGLLDCGHIFHSGCLSEFFKAQIEISNLDIRCPMEGCCKKLNSGDIYPFTEKTVRQKYQTFSFNKYVEENNASNSWCPTAGCQAVFEFQADVTEYCCPSCKKHYCLKCKSDYHTGMSCAQYRVNNIFDNNDEKFVEFAKGAHYKQCPKCKYWVQRTQGCNHMTCKCGQHFCYKCGRIGCSYSC